MKPATTASWLTGAIASLAMMLFLLAGTSFAASPAATETYPLCGTAWVVTQIEGYPVSGRAPTLLIIGKKASGFGGGANRYSCNIELGKKNALHFGTIASTRMACEGTARKQETDFFRGLAATASYHLNNDYLVLLDSHFNKLLEFAPRRSDAKR